MDTEWTSEESTPAEDLPEGLPELDPETLAAVQGLQAGEIDESTRHIFETFEPQLRAYFQRKGCQDDEAEDLAQNVFMQMLEQIGTLKDATRFHFWLFKIAGNHLRNFLRDRGRSKARIEDLTDRARKDSESDAFWVRGTFEPNPEAKLTMSETVDRRRLVLRKLLQVTKLAPRTCQSLVRRFHGDSYEEIADALEIPVGTVGSHISRATAALLRNLEKIDLEDVTLDDGTSLDDDIVADLSTELLTFKKEALEADPAYFRAGTLEAASAYQDETEESDDEALVLLADEDEEDHRDYEDDEDDEDGRVVDSEIAAVVKEDRARGRSRQRVTRTIPPAGRSDGDVVLGRLGKDELGYPVILLEEAAAALNGHGGGVPWGVGVPREDVHGADRGLALKAKLTCAGALLARGRRFKVARQVGEIVRQAIILIHNSQCNGNGHKIHHKVAEGRTLLRSYLDHQQKGDSNHVSDQDEHPDQRGRTPRHVD